MHDTTDLENRGIPALFVASAEFVEAARSQSAALGFEPASIFVAHPIQDRTDQEMKDLADAAFDRILRALSSESI